MKDNQEGARPMDFARIISPITPDVFLQEYFDRKHLVVRRDDPDYYEGLLSVADIDRILTDQMIPGDEMQMVRTGKGIPVEQYHMSNGLVDPVRVARFFSEGATIVLPGLHKRLPALAAYCRALETVFNVDLQTNIYFTPAGSQGFKTHYDSHDVLVLQIAGSKTWNIYDSRSLELPLRSQAFQPDGFEPGELIDTFTLHAGDMCYVPRGVVHDARSTDDQSLHITTGLLSPRWIDLLLDAMNQVALTDVDFRRAIPPGHAMEGFDRTEARKVFKDLLHRAAELVDPDHTLDFYANDFRNRRIPVAPRQLLQSFDADAIDGGSVMARRPDLIHAVRREADEVVLSVYGIDVAFPAHVEEALRAALAMPEFTVGDLPGDLDTKGQVVLARRLLREGVLIRVA